MEATKMRNETSKPCKLYMDRTTGSFDFILSSLGIMKIDLIGNIDKWVSNQYDVILCQLGLSE